MARKVILSPHLDDAVLSCYEQLDKNTMVISVFAGVPDNKYGLWDFATGSFNANKRAQARIEENSKALSFSGSQIINLDFLDYPYSNKPRDTEKIKQKIKSLITKDDLIFASAGLGKYFSHPDHISTRQIGISLLNEGYKVTFYADIPYCLPLFNRHNWAANIDTRNLKLTFNTQVHSEMTILTPDKLAEKKKALQAYASQLKILNLLSLGSLNNDKVISQELLIYYKD